MMNNMVKMTDRILNTLYQFIGQSGSFGGFSFNGNYFMKNEDFFAMYRHFIKTGENLLDFYSDCIYLSWDYDSKMEGHGCQIQVLSPDDHIKLSLGINQLEKLNLLDSDTISNIRGMAKLKLREYHLQAKRDRKKK